MYCNFTDDLVCFGVRVGPVTIHKYTFSPITLIVHSVKNGFIIRIVLPGKTVDLINDQIIDVDAMFVRRIGCGNFQ